MIPIIDAHHHIWRQADLPWLQGPMVPRIFGPYEPIRRDYPIEEFLADISGTGIEKSVYVQCNWAKDKAVDEVAWVQSVADAHGWPHAIVGYADMTGPQVEEALDAHIAAEEGRGRTQVRGEAMVELLPGGSPNYTAAGVVHWHGAAPDEHVVQLTFMGGPSGADWFEPVSNGDYRGQ